MSLSAAAMSVSTAAPYLPALVGHNATAVALLNLTVLSAALPVPARRLSALFEFNVQDALKELQKQVGEWKDAASKAIKDALSGIPGLDKIVEVIKKSVKLAERGLQIMVSAAKTLGTLTAQLLGVYTTFKPLIPVFESKNFLMEMITSMDNIKALLSVIGQLLGTAGTLSVLSGVCKDAEEVFEELSNVYGSAMSKLSEDEKRRLREETGRGWEVFTYPKFLNGIDFDNLRAKMLEFRTQADTSAEDLGEVNTTLSHLMVALRQGKNVTKLSTSPADYQKAIEKVIPVWQTVEGLGHAVCRGVMTADHEASALVCRVHNFVNKAGALIGLKDLLGDCPVSTEMKECPDKMLSDEVADQILHHSGILGWLLYLFAGLLSCGCVGGTAAAVKKLRAPKPTGAEVAPLVGA